MSTLELENIKHPDNSGDNIALASNGNVGIGTGSPSDRLHLQKSNDNGIIIENTTGATLSLLSTGAGRVRSSGTLIFDTGGATERMRVGSNGYVGVGTSTPLRKLHIADAGDTHIILQSTNAADNSEIFEIGAGANSASKVDLTFRTRLNSGSGGTEHMRITNDGYVTTPNQPYFAAVCAGTSAYTSFGQAVALPFNSTARNIGGHFNTSNYRFTAPVTGKYAFSAGVITNDGNPVGRMMFFINGSQDYLGIKFGISGSNTAGGGSTNTSAIIHLLANDYVDVRSQSGSMIAYTGGGHSSFTGTLIS